MAVEKEGYRDKGIQEVIASFMKRNSKNCPVSRVKK